jgi:hypothetical protein
LPLILLAEHGLVDPDQILSPYDRKMGDPACATAETITWQAAALGIDFGDEACASLAASYYSFADEGLRELDVFLQDVYEGTAGIGERSRQLDRHPHQPGKPTGPQVPRKEATMAATATRMSWIVCDDYANAGLVVAACVHRKHP